ncbi:MAG: electron transfer flavoprotein subunit beta/FixA family protein [Desulfobacterales bacterium]|nr:electron transfer flavoprotein subunit beta/FixA family protein [Desulfobacterales bacterium]
MNIIVLMKQVPDTEAPVEIAESKDRLDTEDLKWAINPYDEFALEEALLIKEAQDDVTVTVLTVGPDRVSEAIRVAYAMGVDNAIHINDEYDEEEFGAVDAYTTSKIIAKVLEETPHDLIICGNRAVDDDNYQVPAFISKMMNIPMISLVTGQTLEDGAIVCEQSIDGGTAVVKAALPALITAQKGLNEPRYPAFRAIMKAKKKKVDERELEDIGFDPETLGVSGAKVKIRSMEFPPERAEGKRIEGSTPAEKAAELVRLLREEANVI